MEAKCDFGIVGLGTMGRNLAYNICDHGFFVSGYDKDVKQVDVFASEAVNRNIIATRSPAEFVQSLKEPRAIILLVPAGSVVDAVVDELKSLLSVNDLIIDGGNSHYSDTNQRTQTLGKDGICFMGAGISGGESGARYGPSIMCGGDWKAYERVSPMLEAIAAKVGNEPCVAWLGNGSSGHYVKMVHNGIEYALMQLIAEAYHLLKQSGAMTNDELHNTFANWNTGRLKSFLIEITADIFACKDDLTNAYLIDLIKDTAHQKGTGAWTSKDAMSLGVAMPGIDIAVVMRNMSSRKAERVGAQKKLKGPSVIDVINLKEISGFVESALYFAMITAYAQGMALLQHASGEYQYSLNLSEIARIWRGGCIIRAALLEQIRAAYGRQPDLPNLMTDEVIARELMESQHSIRSIIKTAVEQGIPVPGMMASLAYYDSYRSSWLPANLIQAQRDYFGAHTYERIDRQGFFHSHWNQQKG